MSLTVFCNYINNFIGAFLKSRFELLSVVTSFESKNHSLLFLI